MVGKQKEGYYCEIIELDLSSQIIFVAVVSGQREKNISSLYL